MRMRAVIAALVVVVVVAAIGVLFWNRLRSVVSVDDGRLRVVTTFAPLYSFTAAIAGDDALVENLLPPGVGPHDFAFAPSEMERLSQADIVVANGLGLEQWLSNAIRTANSDVTLVEASNGIAMREPDTALQVDPHVWLDPIRAQTMAANIALALATADPAHASAYGTRRDALVARLAALDKEIRTGLSGAFDRRFVGFHDAFGYFAERYGLQTVAVIETSPGKEPSPRDVAQIVSLIRRSGVKALFTEPQFSPALVEAIAVETGLATHSLDPLETAAFSADGYFDGMRANLVALRVAFGIQP
ncbi:MAG: zinc ABC transporter substrate-binding protein [Patescibacteria group bacterium]